MLTTESLYETIIALSNGTIADPYDLPNLKMGVAHAPHTHKFATSAATWQIEEQCRLLPNQ